MPSRGKMFLVNRLFQLYMFQLNTCSVLILNDLIIKWFLSQVWFISNFANLLAYLLPQTIATAHHFHNVFVLDINESILTITYIPLFHQIVLLRVLILLLEFFKSLFGL